MKRKTPEATYRAEKEKRARPASHEELMAEAKAAFDQFLADGKAARKGGRPKRTPAKPAASAEPEAEGEAETDDEL
ncbi:MAG: hypothetical protein ACJ79S_05920 [Gemmatimonadaceae bacterium]